MQYKLNCNCLTLKILFTYNKSCLLFNHLKIGGEKENIIQNGRTFIQAISSKVCTSILHMLSNTHTNHQTLYFGTTVKVVKLICLSKVQFE